MNKVPTIEQINEAIALFMGGSSIKEHGGHRYVYYQSSCARCVDELKYHSSWDWLMPVWKKAGEVLYDIRGDLSDTRYLEAHKITKAFMDACQKVELDQAHKAVYNALQFIQWYNNQSTPHQ